MIKTNRERESGKSALAARHDDDDGDDDDDFIHLVANLSLSTTPLKKEGEK